MSDVSNQTSEVKENVEKSKRGFIVWVKQHRKQLAIAGVSVTTIIGLIFAIRNREAIMKLWASLQRAIAKAPAEMPDSEPIQEITTVRKYTTPHVSFTVDAHVRNLANGRHASAEKSAKAAELGYKLLPGQTWVDSYVKGGAAA